MFVQIHKIDRFLCLILIFIQLCFSINDLEVKRINNDPHQKKKTKTPQKKNPKTTQTQHNTKISHNQSQELPLSRLHYTENIFT